MNDLDHWWGNDLAAGNTGDVQAVTSTLRGQQRIVRRLLTNPGDYIFHPEYGAGLPAYIGQPMDIPKVTALIRSQVLLEDVVAKTPDPVITIAPMPMQINGFTVTILYTDAVTKTQETLSFDVTR